MAKHPLLDQIRKEKEAREAKREQIKANRLYNTQLPELKQQKKELDIDTSALHSIQEEES